MMTSSPGRRGRTFVRLYNNPGEVAQAAAEILLDAGRDAQRHHASRFVALSGGSTPKAMYDVLRGMGQEAAKALRALHYFFGDERSVDNWDEESNVRLAMEGFALPLRLPLSHFYAPDGAAAGLDEEAARLTSIMQALMPKDEHAVPRFRLVFLGMGEDGHTASLFPGTKALHSGHLGFVCNDVPQKETRRLTLTYPVLNAAERVVLLVTGGAKAKVLGEIFTRDASAPIYPVERLAAPERVWILDQEAAAEIPESVLGRFS